MASTRTSHINWHIPHTTGEFGSWPTGHNMTTSGIGQWHRPTIIQMGTTIKIHMKLAFNTRNYTVGTLELRSMETDVWFMLLILRSISKINVLPHVGRSKYLAMHGWNFVIFFTQWTPDNSPVEGCFCAFIMGCIPYILTLSRFMRCRAIMNSAIARHGSIIVML